MYSVLFSAAVLDLCVVSRHLGGCGERQSAGSLCLGGDSCEGLVYIVSPPKEISRHENIQLEKNIALKKITAWL